MKHSLKISSLIIFAATVASAFTSCGNDSELFEEPIMYQTRAITRASMGGEGGRRYVTTNGPSIGIYPLTTGEAHIEVTFNWNSGYETEINYSVLPTPVFKDDNPHNEGSLYAHIFEITEKPYITSDKPYITERDFKEYLTVDIKGTIYEYIYSRATGEIENTIRHDIAHQCIAQNDLGIEYR